jgi:23S rRNA (pseudouridine1915-N3)-methyltransferase
MKITLLVVGKTEDKYLIEGIQKAKEAELIHKQISNLDTVILMDEKGKKYTSVAFSNYLNKQMIGSVQHLVFIIGGPYGFDESIYKRANGSMSLSDMTFSHQMVRLFFVEQLYRAFSILKGEPYHHQ